MAGFLWCCLPTAGSAQQDPMFTKYVFNSLVFNPAYAGSLYYLSVNLLYREQWAGWGSRFREPDNGAPITQSLTLHGPMGKRIGVGLNVINDVIGARQTTSVNATYAYRIDFGTGKLAFGIQGGAMYWRADWRKLNERDPGDPVFAASPSAWIPNVGAGLYYHSRFFYVGVSAPHLLQVDLPLDGVRVGADNATARLYRHYYLFTGGAIPLSGPNLVFKPSLLIKSVGALQDFTGDGTSLNAIGAPTEFDVDVSLFMQQTLWVGMSFRSALEAVFAGKSSVDSADFWAAYYLKNGFRIGAAYDFPLNDLRRHTNGSFELMLGYDFQYNVIKTATPRYF